MKTLFLASSALAIIAKSGDVKEAAPLLSKAWETVREDTKTPHLSFEMLGRGYAVEDPNLAVLARAVGDLVSRIANQAEPSSLQRSFNEVAACLRDFGAL